MPANRFLFAAVVFLAIPVLAQQTVQTTEQTPQAASLIQQSTAALTAGMQVNDVTMSGTVTATFPTDTESGTITLEATAAGQSQVILNLPSGTRSNVRNYTVTPHAGTGTGLSGPQSEQADNLVGPNPAWFYPAFILSAADPTNFVSTYAGQETHNTLNTQHVLLQAPVLAGLRSVPTEQTIEDGLPPDKRPRRAGQHDFYLDPATSLPLALVRSIRVVFQHPEKLAPVARRPVYVTEEVRYSNYQTVQGNPVAFGMQVYQNNQLFLNIQLSSVSFNTGVTIPTPAAAN